MTPAANPRRQTSGAVSNVNLKHYWHKPNLGDKLQRLARLSPKHVRALDQLVDQLIRELLSKPTMMIFVGLGYTLW